MLKDGGVSKKLIKKFAAVFWGNVFVGTTKLAGESELRLEENKCEAQSVIWCHLTNVSLNFHQGR